MRRVSILLTAVTIALAAAGGAAASGAAASGRDATITISPQDVNGAVDAVVSGARWQVSGVMSVYRPGQVVAIHVFDNGRRTETLHVRVRKQGATGVFHVALKIGGVGRITVHAVHFRSSALPEAISNFASAWVVAPTATPGEGSLAVRILQSQLAALHYVVGSSGVFDEQTQLGLVAFQKMTGLPITGVPDAAVFAALAAGDGAFPVKFPSHGRHIEGDLTHQVLALIGAHGQVEALYDMSSGKPSTPTAPGSFRVYSKTPGVNDEGMVDSNYFNGGDAIHGYPEVPAYAASHGCLRVPILDALQIYDWVALGTPVDVFFR
jgi:hypothetical protein